MEPDHIYDLIKQKIIWLELAPESVLNLSVLAEEFRLSRTPVKEALILLQGEGWIHRQGPYFMVTSLSLDRMREITEIRSVIEVQANLWAMHRMSGKEVATLGELAEKMLHFDESQPNRFLVELDFRFHKTFYQGTKNNQLAQMLERLLSHYLRFWLSMDRKIEPKSFFEETIQIVRALESKDEGAVAEATTAHIRKSVQEIMGFR
jgi:DNA-binding GntR family transcriptional regulator